MYCLPWYPLWAPNQGLTGLSPKNPIGEKILKHLGLAFQVSFSPLDVIGLQFTSSLDDLSLDRGRPSLPFFHRGYTRAFGSVILNHGQVTWTTPDLAPLLLTATPQKRKDVPALDRFSVHCSPTRRVWYWARICDKPATIRCLDHSAVCGERRRATKQHWPRDEITPPLNYHITRTGGY
ncbi:hypothetical protein TNCV_560921 [Trichonephila clavipes]|nr:hypothetical protein TNCV_560921 [Trichonephila clavipes]